MGLLVKPTYFFLGASLTGTGTGTGAGAGTGTEACETGSLRFFSIFSCRMPSPYMVMVTINNMVVMEVISQRLGFSIKNKGHFGLYMPSAKNINVIMPKFIACKVKPICVVQNHLLMVVIILPKLGSC